jgi:hypothetical protein
MRGIQALSRFLLNSNFLDADKQSESENGLFLASGRSVE